MILKNNKRFNLLISLLICSVIAAVMLLPAVQPMIQQSKVKVIIDAGHGLPDGGAVGLDGTTEQFLNLQIAKELSSLYSPDTSVMTREGEEGIATSGTSIRDKKISDMRERVSIAQKYSDALIISIHMNTFPNGSVYGCQVFYRADCERSKAVAATLQKLINEKIQPNHTKNVKTLDKSLYFFKNTKNPAVLIECGFITNENDLNQLKNKDFQKQLAQLIYSSIEQ